jgi:hypothetical protein
METYTISDYEWARDFYAVAGERGVASDYQALVTDLKKRLPCSCGSKEFYMAPIVSIRCAECNKPL